MRQPIRLALGALALAALSACSSVKLDETAGGAPIDNRGAASAGSGAAGGAAGSASAAGAGGPGGRQITPVDATRPDPLNDPAGALAKRSIYFDFDQYVIRDEFKGTVDAHAKYLVANKARKVVIQGNTDPRGSREYNLALGQKRAEAVRKALVSLGVADPQLEAVSFGEEKPKATGTSEAAMAENRRADLVYQ